MNKCMGFMRNVDEKYMKPFFIYKYEHDIAEGKEEFLDLFEKEGDKWEKVYL